MWLLKKNTTLFSSFAPSEFARYKKIKKMQFFFKVLDKKK
jgi:hypothetical protein